MNLTRRERLERCAAASLLTTARHSHLPLCSAVKYSPDGKWLAVGFHEGTPDRGASMPSTSSQTEKPSSLVRPTKPAASGTSPVRPSVSQPCPSSSAGSTPAL